MFSNITFEKEKHKAEGSFKVLNMDTICYWAVFKGREIKNILNLLRQKKKKRRKPGA